MITVMHSLQVVPSAVETSHRTQIDHSLSSVIIIGTGVCLSFGLRERKPNRFLISLREKFVG